MHVVEVNHKPSATSAAVTAFSADRLDGPGDLHLWIDGNGKITAGNGTLDAPKPNAFSLVQIDDCPGSTAACRASCYVHGLEKHAKDTHDLYRHNSKTMREILETRAMADAWALKMADYISTNCAGGFRWHVSGDVFSLEYAKWIEAVCYHSRDVRHWIYTRSHDLLDVLWHRSTTKGGNLSINVSADADNFVSAQDAAGRLGLRMCLMVTSDDLAIDPESTQLALDELHDHDVIFPDYELRGGTPEGQVWFAALPPRNKAMVCPVDYHGKAENRRCGPCDRCLK